MNSRKHFFRPLCAALLTLALALSLFAPAFATSSADIKEELKKLEERADEIDSQKDALQEKIDANNAETLTVVEQRSQVDQEVSLLYEQMQNLNDQLKQYNLLIAEKQAELDDLQTQQTELLARYKQRLRAMQEQGDISYWAVIFRASSFSEMLNRIAMVEEIAKSDQRMMDELRDLASDVLAAKEDLAAEKVTLEDKKVELAETEKEFEAKRAESEKLLDELIAHADELNADMEEIEDQKNALAEEIAQREKDYNDAKRREEEANRPKPGDNTGGGSGGGGGTTEGSFLYPLPRSCGAWVSSPYGYRYHPISGTYTFHSGVDLAAPGWTPIYASKSGTVTTSSYADRSWGNYVVINHGDGYSTLYAHMVSRAASVGQYVNVYYNGNLQNPLNYISVP